MKPWKTLSKRSILEHGEFLTVESHRIELPDGRIIEDWPWIITRDFVIVLCVTAEGKFLCFRQVKYGVNGPTLAPVGGYIEADEDPLDAAKRELLEEVGNEATEWIDLGSYQVGGNRGIATAYLYLARDARLVTEPINDDLEEQQLLRLSQFEVEKALLKGEFKVLSWTAAVALALHYMKMEEK